MTAPLAEVDPFDLPDWLGEAEVTWTSASGVRTGHHVVGRLTAPDEPELTCDLLAIDQAYPAPVADDQTRLRAHQVWQHGQVLLTAYDARLTLAVPGTCFTADLILDALGRLAKAVGASAEHYTARLRLGAESGQPRH